MGIVLGPNRFGKAEVRMLHLHRTAAQSVLTDLNVSTHLSGDLDAVHLTGDNTGVLTTDAQKNTVYAFAAQEAPGEPEAFGLKLARHFLSSVETVSAAVVELDLLGWDRLGPHAFSRHGERRTAKVTVSGEGEWVVSGLTDLTVLRSQGSEFERFFVDPLTSLPETRDRLLATAITATWRHVSASSDWGPSFDAVRSILLSQFETAPSKSLQQTLFCMGSAVLEARPEIAEVRLTMPNKHHFVADLARFGVENSMGPGVVDDLDVVFTVPDRPYGLIEGTVLRDDVPLADWAF